MDSLHENEKAWEAVRRNYGFAGFAPGTYAVALVNLLRAGWCWAIRWMLRHQFVTLSLGKPSTKGGN